MAKKLNVSALVMVLVVAVATFLIIAAVIMALWNGPLMKALKKGAINKIGYGDALGLTLLFAIVFPGGIIVTQKCGAV